MDMFSKYYENMLKLTEQKVTKLKLNTLSQEQ